MHAALTDGNKACRQEHCLLLAMQSNTQMVLREDNLKTFVQDCAVATALAMNP